MQRAELFHKDKKILFTLDILSRAWRPGAFVAKKTFLCDQDTEKRRNTKKICQKD
jgi:hypothetical protein